MSNEIESSIPQEDAHLFRSSPPSPTQLPSLGMDDTAASKSMPVALQHAQQTPKRPKHKRINSDDTERPASAQLHHVDSEEHSDVESEHESSENEDPAAQITSFDWDGLHQQYHAVIDDCSRDEAALLEEWANLMEFFRVWAESGHAHETNRTFQRLQTRTKFVHHEEQKLEEKRSHYVNVVRAFESALNLLKASSLPG